MLSRRGDLVKEYKLLKELHRRQSRKSLSKFITFNKVDYDMQWFQKLICDKLDALLDGTLGKKKLMIFVPPQHGKSEISSRQFPAYVLGKNPKTKIALCSYSSDLASGFNRNIQQIIDTEDYESIFPDTRLNSSNVSTDVSRGVLRNSNIFEIVKHRGFLKSVGVGGGLTGTPVDLGIIDDPFKDRQEARSQTMRDKVWSWYEDVFSSRLHNDSIQLLLFTRWHEDDIAGRLLEREADEWEVVAIPCLKEETSPLKEAVEINDPRQVDEALWEQKHSAKRIKKIRQFSPITFNSLYQQRPTAQEGNMMKIDWFETVVNFNPNNYKFEIYVDGAYTNKTNNDPTAILHIAYNKNEIIIINSTTVRMELFELLEYFPKYCEVQGFDKRRGKVWIEPKASGKSLRSMFQKNGFNAIEIPNKQVSAGKISRVEDSAPSIQGGKVKVVKGAWNNSFFEEVAGFPNAKHDDQVDNLCYAVIEHFISPQKITMKRSN